MKDTGIHHLRLLHLLGKLSFFMFLPIWIIFDLRKLLVADDLVSRVWYAVTCVLA